jgi:S-adenosylmethionine-diacylglycerol 3-amino-3-carboxypropyl transferase
LTFSSAAFDTPIVLSKLLPLSQRRTDISPTQRLRYGVVWEDANVLCDALRPVAKDGVLLTIASAGDNALALLLLDPREIVAIDIEEAQLAALELRIAAIAALPNSSVRHFLGADGETDTDRLSIYTTIRMALSLPAREFWDARTDDVSRGIIHAGSFERYLRFFRRRILPLLVPREAIQAILRGIPPSAKEHVYDAIWDTIRWRIGCGMFFSSAALSRIRFPGALRQLRHGSAAELQKRARHVLTNLTSITNPYLTYLFQGRYTDDALPLYLEDRTLDVIRPRLQRLRIINSSVTNLTPLRTYNGMNLSDIFEPFTSTQFEQHYMKLFALLRPGGRLVYWSHFVPRTSPHLGTRCQEESERLHSQDQVGSYGSLHIDQAFTS